MTDETATADVATPATAPAPSETEVKAREQGWVPKEEFKKNPANWVSAEEYVQRDDPRYLRKKMRDAEKASAATTQKLAQQIAAQEEAFKDRLDRMGKASAKALELQRTRIYEEFEAKKEAAVEDGDLSKYNAIKAQEAKARKEFAEEDAELAVTPEPKKAVGNSDDADKALIRDWWADHQEEWHNERKAAFVGLLYSKAESDPKLKTTADRLRFVDEALSKSQGKNGDSDDDRVPEARMPSVEKGARTAANGVRKKGWSDIPSEEKAIYAKHIKEGLYKDQAEAASVHWE